MRVLRSASFTSNETLRFLQEARYALDPFCRVVELSNLNRSKLSGFIRPGDLSGYRCQYKSSGNDDLWEWRHVRYCGFLYCLLQVGLQRLIRGKLHQQDPSGYTACGWVELILYRLQEGFNIWRRGILDLFPPVFEVSKGRLGPLPVFLWQEFIKAL